ncbi:MAG: hypothetical protein NDF55_08815 [archaeon GB-1867-005]|nr:hypothetical protein [Candidatus Culexmicrobium cathedralense]
MPSVKVRLSTLVKLKQLKKKLKTASSLDDVIVRLIHFYEENRGVRS